MKHNMHNDHNGNTIHNAGKLGVGVVNPAEVVEINSGVGNNSGLRLHQLTLLSVMTADNVALGVNLSGKVHVANGVKSADNRSFSPIPRELQNGRFQQFKDRNVAARGSDLIPSGGYAGVEEIRPYGLGGDFSGGGVAQVLRLDDGRSFQAISLDSSTWDIFREVGGLDKTRTAAAFSSQNYTDQVIKRNDWGGANNIKWDAANRGLNLNDVNCAAGLMTRMPLVKGAIYEVEFEITKVAGAGVFYFGAFPFNISAGAVQAWIVSGENLGVGVTKKYSFKLTEAQLSLGANPQYFDLMFLGNYGGAPGAVTRINSVKVKQLDVASLMGQSDNNMVWADNVCAINANSSGVVGALVIDTQILQNSACMFRLELEGYDYSAFSAWDLQIGGYMYTGNDFYNHGYGGKHRRGFSLPGDIKLGIRNGRVQIIIGNAATVWQYPKIRIKSVMLGHSGGTFTRTTGWAMNFENTAALATIANQTNLSLLA